MAKQNTTRRTALVCVIAGLVLLAGVLWLNHYLQPTTWKYYTDGISTRRLARDVKPHLVLWEKAAPLQGSISLPADDVQEPAISPDGTTLVFTRGLVAGNADLYFARWNGKSWTQAESARALNSKFHERAPTFSRDGRYLFFSSDRPGGMGGYDIWVARWDGAEFAWPQPLGRMVNSPFDEIGPTVSADDKKLYFSSNRPKTPLTKTDDALPLKELRQKYAGADYDIYVADRSPKNMAVERALSILYSLRQSALSDPAVMEKLGGSKDTESAVDRALAWLATQQETNGCWSIEKSGGQPGHNVAATACALLAYFGRGERHDQEYRYKATVSNGVKWLLAQQNKLTGDLRGPKPGQNAMYDQAIGTLALAEAYGLTKNQELFEAAQSAVFFLVDAQDDDGGGWRYQPKQTGDLSVSGWVILALKSAELSGIHVSQKTQAGMKKFLSSVSTGEQGGLYSYIPTGQKSTPAMNATGFFCSQLMGLPANTPRAFETAGFLNQAKLTGDDVYFVYYGTLSAYQHQGPTWRRWSRMLQDKILTMQTPDGSWQITGGHAQQMGRVINTALMALSLQAHYRYTPLYGLGFEPASAPKTFATLNGDQLPPMTEYDRARPVPELNSPADDRYIVASEHGDFLYFASNRAGGYGGFDLYRARVSGQDIESPENLGAAINTAGDETAAAVDMAGFRLVFCSNHSPNKGKYTLRQAIAREVFQRYAYRTPDWNWVWANYQTPLLIALVGVLVFGFSTVTIVRAERRHRE